MVTTVNESKWKVMSEGDRKEGDGEGGKREGEGGKLQGKVTGDGDNSE